MDRPVTKMSVRAKAIYINIALVFGLALEFYRGRSLTVIAITGCILFAVANIALLFSRKANEAR